MTLRAKFVVQDVNRSIDGAGQSSQEHVRLRPVYSSDPESENAQWSKWTPAGSIELHINNPGAFGKLPLGKEFYVDFIAAEVTD